LTTRETLSSILLPGGSTTPCFALLIPFPSFDLFIKKNINQPLAPSLIASSRQQFEAFLFHSVSSLRFCTPYQQVTSRLLPELAFIP